MFYVFSQSDCGKWRTRNEDRVVNFVVGSPSGESVSVAGVLDGHGGSDIVNFVHSIMPQTLHHCFQYHPLPSSSSSSSLTTIIETILHQWCDLLQAQICRDRYHEAQQQGTTLCVLVAYGSRYYYAVNVGDSRLTVLRAPDGTYVMSTRDHKPSDYAEACRIRNTGGFVDGAGADGVARVRGLAVSRALGDLTAVPLVTHQPDITRIVVPPPFFFNTAVGAQSNFSYYHHVVIATDGLWDVVTNDDVAEFVAKKEKDISSPALVPQQCVAEARNRGSTDNITVVLVLIAANALHSSSSSSSR